MYYINCLTLTLLLPMTLAYNLSLTDYTVCKYHHSKANILSEMVVKRRIMCGIQCGRIEACRAVTVYALSSSEYRCVFHEGFYSMDCHQFMMLDTTDVRMLIKNDSLASSEMVNGCYNGGTRAGPVCNCPLGYTGTECERVYYDCEEGKTLGVPTTGFLHVIIQPRGYPEPFEIICNAIYGFPIFVSRKLNIPGPSFARPLSGYKYGFGTGFNFWSGLERMHALLNQPGMSYRIQLYCEPTSGGSLSRYIPNVNVDSQAAGYSFRSDAMVSDDAMDGASGPLYFCAYDSPCSGNPPPGEGGWWFSASNADYSLTRSAGKPKWIQNGNDVECDYISMQIERNP